MSSDVTEAIVSFLRERGAGELPHARGRSLLEHLSETAAILGRWRQPEWLQHAALLHSVYGTDAYRRQLLSDSDREVLAALAGPRTERLAYLFARTPRRPLLAGTHRWAPGVLGDPAPTRAELDALVVLHMANLAEQAAARDGSPGRWLAQLGRLAGHLADSETITLPSVFAALLHLTDEDEERARQAYRAGLAENDREQLAIAAASCPVLAEPCIHLGWSELARERLTALGAAWDKRHTYQEWLEHESRRPHPRPGRAGAAASASCATSTRCRPASAPTRSCARSPGTTQRTFPSRARSRQTPARSQTRSGHSPRSGPRPSRSSGPAIGTSRSSPSAAVATRRRAPPARSSPG